MNISDELIKIIEILINIIEDLKKKGIKLDGIFNVNCNDLKNKSEDELLSFINYLLKIINKMRKKNVINPIKLTKRKPRK